MVPINIFLFLLALVCSCDANQCYECRSSNQIDDWDSNHCFQTPNSSITNVANNCSACSIEITNHFQYYVIQRKCLSKLKATVGCTGPNLPHPRSSRKCYCGDSKEEDICNSNGFTFECLSCAYSSEGSELYMNGKTYKSDLSCLFIGTNTSKVQCQTRCMESLHSIPTKSGAPDFLLFRDCEPDLTNTQNVVKKIAEYVQCGTNLCNSRLPLIPIYAPRV